MREENQRLRKEIASLAMDGEVARLQRAIRDAKRRLKEEQEAAAAAGGQGTVGVEL